MTSFAERALSVIGSLPTHPGKLLESLPNIVQRILPHARYSSFLETLVAGSHAFEAPSHITPSVLIQDGIPSKDLTTHTRCLHERISSPGRELQTPPSSPNDSVFCILYKTRGKFAWMNGRTIENVKTLKWLGEGIMSCAHIKSGDVRTPCQGGWDSVTFNYVCKTWDMSRMRQWDGFYSELALYKSSRYLLTLQGDVVPHVIGVYTRPGKIDIAMDLPHPVLWMEASAAMPVVLKDRVVEAFQKLHERGVVHGDVALRHILIGADARVKLIDFQASRADEPNEDLGLAATYPGEKDLEMRRVKFLLNMGNARKKEFRKSKAAHKRSSRNRARAQRRRELLQHGITTGLPLDEPEPLEDVEEPPVPLGELEEYWMEDANDNPRRFVVPSASDSEVAEAISSFLRCIRDLEEADCGWSVAVSAPTSPRSPLNSPTLPPRHGGASVPELPPSIRIRDFAYESTCWSSTPRRQVARDTALHNTPLPPSPPAMEVGVSCCERGNTLTHVTGQMKRCREESEEKPPYIEKFPAGKRPRLDSTAEYDPILDLKPISRRACESGRGINQTGTC